MKIKILTVALLVSVSSTAFAQDIQSNSGSDAAANSGSVSAAQSNGNLQGQSQSGGNNAGIGSSTSESNSGAVAITESTSGSSSNSDQGQSQGQSLTNGNTVGQQATNQQGVTVNQTWNAAAPLKRTYVGTNNAIPLAASSSFSSDYCGGTVSGGASAAPIGISIGASGVKFDKSCQSLRRAEKFGMAAANWSNMGFKSRAVAMMRMMEWSICTADSGGPKADKATAEACAVVLGMGSTLPDDASYMAPPEPAGEVTPLETQKPNVTPSNEYDHPEKQYRGEVQKKATINLGG